MCIYMETFQEMGEIDNNWHFVGLNRTGYTKDAILARDMAVLTKPAVRAE